MKEQLWDLFISHASEDKNEIARPPAEKLRDAGLRVWYDEFSLKLGDSFRRSIEKGISESKYGVVILSPNFFAKEWPQRELDSLTAREIDSGKIILPIWHNVTRKDVVRFSPNLADKLAVSTEKGLNTVVQQICALFEEEVEEEQAKTEYPSEKISRTPVIRLRNKPLMVSEKETREVFRLISWSPREYIQNNFEDKGDVVIDYATGLMWQKSGSDKTLTYEEAQAYIEELNREQFAGYTDWSLPTIPELMSLLEPEKQVNDLYINLIFDTKQKWCWSSDQESLSSVWLIHFIAGVVTRHNIDPRNYVRRNYVRAVRAW